MPTRDASVPQLSPGQANYVLDRLVRDRRISQSDVSRYLGEMQREIEDLEQRLQNLRAAAEGGRGPAPQAGAQRPARRGRPAAAPAPAASAAKKAGNRNVTASMRLQGRYLGLIRQIPENRRAHYANIAKERGREVAIREMEAALRTGASKGATKAPARPAATARRRRAGRSPSGQDESRKLQGKYLSLIRQIPENRRAQYAKIAKEKGRDTAIREMQDALRK